MGSEPKDYDLMLFCITCVTNSRNYPTRGKFIAEMMTDAHELYAAIQTEIEEGRVAVNSKSS